jgi:cytochrome b
MNTTLTAPTPATRPDLPPAPEVPEGPARGRRITDAFIRTSHWLMALSFTLAYISGDSERWRLLHVAMGYTMAGLLAVRLLYGLLGPRTVRLSMLWRRLAGAGAVWRSTAQATRLSELPWRAAQNLMLPGSIVAILALILPLVLSGHATYDEWGAAWGGEWVNEALAEVHEALGKILLITVLGHLAWILGLSLLRRRNLALPMLTGRSDTPGPDLVTHRQHLLATGLALATLVASLGFCTWFWWG